MKNLTARLVSSDMAKPEARNAARHIVALTLTKIADGLIDPKLVLSWLLGILGAPTVYVGLLVPIREAGALLPQLVFGAILQRLQQRRWVWVIGSAVQGLAAAMIAVAAFYLTGWAAGLAVCALLAVLALARAACSVSYKDILGKTVGQSRRGAVTGLAGSVSAAAVLVFAALLLTGVLQTRGAIIGAIGIAALAWGIAAIVLARLDEENSTPETSGATGGYLTILRNDANLRRFILVRGLLVSTALAPPYMVLLSAQGGAALNTLGALVLASSGASFLSSYIWGRMADDHSPKVLLLAGVAAGCAMLAAIFAEGLGFAKSPGVIPAILFLLMLAYHGARQARSVYLVDISDENKRSQNAALANTAIGIILLLAGAFGGALSFIGPTGALAGFAAMSFLGGGLALTLRSVEG
ncbi:MAG: MFS transporter [Roseovarius sp.]|nr:MFS transporter [Roseovarius sp.]